MTYDRIESTSMWDVFKVYSVGGRLLNGVETLYKKANTCIRINGDMNESF